jgi:diguanylate cyclase
MQKSSEAHHAGARRRIDRLLRSVMMSLFAAGALAIGVLWVFESKYGLIDEVCRIAYPMMLTAFIASAAMLYRWPNTVVIARWVGFCAISGFLFTELMASLWTDGPLVGNYAFISLLMWLPLAYAIALFMLEPNQASWAACAIFVLIAILSIEHIIHSRSMESGDTALLVNLLVSHVVLLACLSGLVKIKRVLFKTDALSRHLFEQASTDPLTGLANRRYGLEMLRMAATEHTADTPSAVMVCDIDRFKDINDRHGHDVGDKVVLAIASVLQKNTRDIDTVVRWGGDEFLIVVPQIKMPALAELAERLRTRVAETNLLDGESHTLSPSLSLGIAEMAPDETLDSWVKRADEALYRAKAGGRNRCVFAHPINTHALPFDAARAAELVLDSD